MMEKQAITKFYDVEVLHDILLQQQHLNKELGKTNDAAIKEIKELREKNKLITEQYESLLRQIQALNRHVYGSKNERYIPDQGLLFDSSDEPLPEPETEIITFTRKKKSRPTPHPHHLIPEEIPRKRIEYKLSEAERICPCGCEKILEKIGEVISERLEHKSAEIYVKRHVRFKYAGCAQGRHVLIANMPTPPIERGIAGPSLLSQIIVDKYEYHQPLHRQQKRLERQGIKLNENSFYDWLCKIYILLTPLLDKLKQDTLRRPIINTDDTPSKVRVKGKDKAKKGYFWIYIGSEDKLQSKTAVYIYTTSREGKWAQEFLGDYQGFIQADAYSGYDKLFNPDKKDHPRLEVGCWMHARRGFVNIVKQSKKVGAAHQALSYIQNLYKIEEEIKNKPPEERLKERKKRAVPILSKFKAWLDIKINQALPKSPLFKAIQYCLNHWDALVRYTQDGRLDIDNGKSERGIRPIGLGRNNWIALGSHHGGDIAALFYSFIETCKLHNVNSYEYFTDILERIQDYPINKIEELLPYNWKKNQNQSPSFDDTS